jgi:uncharacterized membrane protein YphA (DoxX/SURF4 family)
MVPLGIRIYGLGAVATGLVGLVWGDFALQWQPVAPHFPARAALAYVFAALLILAGIAVNSQRLRVAGAAMLTVLYAIVVVLMQGANIIQHPGEFATWSGAAEQVALLSAGLAAYAWLRADRLRGSWDSNQLLHIATIAMGVCLLTFGVAHFLYLQFTASMVPAWIPGGQRFWALLTGVAHIAAGIALLTGVKARLAAVLLTVMFASFGLLIHLPLLLAQPDHLNWVMNSVNLALTGAAWTIAHSLLQPNTRHEPVEAGVADLKA